MALHPGVGHDRDGVPSQSPLFAVPGGPGVSGAQFLTRSSGYLRSIVGPDIDIISFDPRGIAHSTPLLDCFATEADGLTMPVIRRHLWESMQYAVPSVNVDNDMSLKMAYARTSAISQLCNDRDEELGNSSIFKFSSTPYIVGDMIGIVDAWSRWRKAFSSAATVSRVGPPDINFWGFSYGSILGATFAAMHPERVGRFILDGVVNTREWYESQLFGDYSDADAILEKFTGYCQAAGTRCSFYRARGTADSIDKRMHRVLNSLKDGPVGFINRSTRLPAVLTRPQLMESIFEGLYKPMTQFPLIADWLMALESRNLTLMSELVSLPSSPLAKRSEMQHYASHYLIGDLNEANNAVTCGDQRGRQPKRNLSQVKSILRNNSRTSTNFTGAILDDVFHCVDWKIKPRRDIPSSLILDVESKDFAPIKTKNPILFVSTSLDPICPLRRALAMVPRFHNASLLEIKAEGHCSFSRRSSCAAKTIRRYLETGDAPTTDVSNGTWLRCEADESPWFPVDAESTRDHGERTQIVL